MSKVLIIGEAPGRRPSVPDEPLAGDIGKRLAALCGLDLATYLRTFERVNVLQGWPGNAGKGSRFPIGAGTIGARLNVVPLLPGRRAILLGRAADVVERALMMAGWYTARDLSFGTGFVWHHVTMDNGAIATLTHCPHPSRVNRWWNVPENRQRAEEFWRSVVSTAPLGS